MPLSDRHPLFVYSQMLKIVEIKIYDNYRKIVFETGETFKLSPEIFAMYTLSKGNTVDRVQYQQLKEESQRYTCSKKALDYLASRNRSALEIENYLYRKGYSRDIIKEIILNLKDSGYIDDYNFALNYIISKKRNKAVGENLLKSELHKKGVSSSIIKRAIEETRNDSDNEELYNLAVKKAGMLGNKKNIESKLIFFLKQRGYNDRDIRSVINEMKKDGYFDKQDDI